MRRPALAALASAAALALTTIALAPSAGAAPSPTGLAAQNVPVCPGPAAAGSAACHAIRHDRVDANGKPVEPAATTPSGYGAQSLQAAYRLSGPALDPAGKLVTPTGPLVAIVDAYDHPNAENDLNVYRSQYGMAPCTTANGCFKKVDQSGTSRYPRSNGGWAQEISLDLDMVSAACPNCRILLVEANSSSFSNLSAAVNTAANLGAAAISNSYGGGDTSSYTTAYEAAAAKHIAVTASTGDNGYGISAPASSPHVVAVGGTSLHEGSGVYTETAWSGAGSGCSTVNPNPGYQTGTPCSGKATADVSAVADPNTGVAVYDSYAYQGRSGWMVFGGTSASSPIIASIYAQGAFTSAASAGEYTWSHRNDLNDVSSGSNGSCSGTLCNAGPGWDGPTGLGSPLGKGTAAF